MIIIRYEWQMVIKADDVPIFVIHKQLKGIDLYFKQFWSILVVTP